MGEETLARAARLRSQGLASVPGPLDRPGVTFILGSLNGPCRSAAVRGT